MVEWVKQLQFYVKNFIFHNPIHCHTDVARGGEKALFKNRSDNVTSLRLQISYSGVILAPCSGKNLGFRTSQPGYQTGDAREDKPTGQGLLARTRVNCVCYNLRKNDMLRLFKKGRSDLVLKMPQHLK